VAASGVIVALGREVTGEVSDGSRDDTRGEHGLIVEVDDDDIVKVDVIDVIFVVDDLIL
jgi:hypothetical protein